MVIHIIQYYIFVAVNLLNNIFNGKIKTFAIKVHKLQTQ